MGQEHGAVASAAVVRGRIGVTLSLPLLKAERVDSMVTTSHPLNMSFLVVKRIKSR